MDDATKSRGRVRTEVGAKRLRAFLDGQVVVDTVRPLFVWEAPYYPTYYVPAADIVATLVDTGEVRRSPSRGDGHVHDVKVASATAAGAALTFPESPFEELRDHVRLEWNSMSAWFEEDEEVFVHARSPYTRVDILPTSRHVEVRSGDTVLADSTHAHVLFETGLPPRWYVPKLDVRMDLLGPSDTITRCPYKGQPVHYTFPLDGKPTDVAWCYETPLRESLNVAGLVAFYDDRVTVLVDGEPAPQTRSIPTQ
jgi:uncharacterized protein (DUF427 family)